MHELATSKKRDISDSSINLVEKAFIVKPNKILRLAPLYFLFMAIASVISIGKNLLFAKLLSVTAFGYLALFNVCIQYGSNFFNLGLLNGLNRELPVSIGQGNESRAIYLRNMVLTSLFFLFLLLIVPYFFILFWWVDNDAQTRAVLLVAYLTSAIMVFYQLSALELRGRQLLLQFSLIFLLQSLSTFAVGIVGSYYWGLKGAISAIIFGYIVAIIISYIFWIDSLRLIKVDFQEIKYMFRIGMPLLISSLCYSFILTMDRLFVVKIFGITKLGQYQFGALIIIAGQMLAAIVMQWVSPQVLYNYGRGVSVGKNFSHILTIMGGILGIILIGWYPFSITASFLVKEYFPKYLEAIPLINIFYLAAGFTTINLPGVILNALNRQVWILAGTIIVTIILFITYLIASYTNSSLVTFAKILLAGQVMLTSISLFMVLLCLRWQSAPEKILHDS